MDANVDRNIETDDTVSEARSARWATPSNLTVSGLSGMPRAEFPAGSTSEVHNINRLLGAIVIGAQANVQWLKSSKPNLEAAQRTSARLLVQIQSLCEMVDGLRPGQT